MSRLRNVPGARDRIRESAFCVTDPEAQKGKWKELFGNSAPVHAEIGMGKGLFLMRQAKLHPEINYVGIEMYSSVLVRAIERAEQDPEAGQNFRFIRMDAKDLLSVFEREEISRIYLNFSDPWPKERHARRRLTSAGFLKIYEELLPEGGRVEFKTDNTGLFDFSEEQAAEEGWTVLLCTRDLYAVPEHTAENVPTEYEEKFVASGNKICKLVLEKGRKGSEKKYD